MACSKRIGTMYTVEPSNFPRFKYFTSRLDVYIKRAKVMCTRLHREIEVSDDIQRRFQKMKEPMRVFVVGDTADRITSASITQSYKIVKKTNIQISDCFDLSLLDLDFVVIAFSWSSIHKDRMNIDALISRYGTEILKKVIFAHTDLTENFASNGTLKALLLDLPDAFECIEQTTNRLELHRALNMNLERKIFSVIEDLKACLRRLKDNQSTYPDERLLMIQMADQLENIVRHVIEHKSLQIKDLAQTRLECCKFAKKGEGTLHENADAYAFCDILLEKVALSFTQHMHGILHPLLRQFVVEKEFAPLSKSLYSKLKDVFFATVQHNASEYNADAKLQDVDEYDRFRQDDAKRKARTQTKARRSKVKERERRKIKTLGDLSMEALRTYLCFQGRDTTWSSMTTFAHHCFVFNHKEEKTDYQKVAIEESTLVFGKSHQLNGAGPSQAEHFENVDKAKKAKYDQEALDNQLIEKEIEACRKMLRKKRRRLCFRLYVDVENVLRRQCEVIRGMLRENAERLFWEVNALFKQSKIPSVRKMAEERKYLPDTLRDTLFTRIKPMRGCGYVFGRLTLLMEERHYTLSQHEIEKELRDILKKHGIVSYDVKTTSSEKLIKPFHTGGVGDEIRGTTPRGTLGGFADCEKGAGPGSRSLCALVSAHVTEGAERISLVMDREQKRSIDIATRVASPNTSTRERCDIDAFEIDSDKECDMKTDFMDSTGIPKRSKLATAENYPDAGAPVHIWGAKSKPGYGTIASTSYHFKTKDNTSTDNVANYILVSDNEGELGQTLSTPFCKEGDSGSIVCADDPDGEIVQVMSMLMGRSSRMENQDRGEDGYATFFLKDGLADLQRRKGMLFNLCNQASSD